MGVETAIVGAAVIGAAGSAMAADSAAGAAGDAAKRSEEAAKYQTDVQKEMYDQTRADQTPWRDTGASALSALSYGAGLSPGYTPGGAPAALTADQLRTQLLPQFTTAAPAATAQSGIDWSNWSPSFGFMLPAAAGATAGATTIDEAGLQAEINRRLAEQSAQAGQSTGQFQGATGINSGDLLRSFSAADFQADPGYQFRMDEGMKALQRSQAAKGGLLSGGAMKGIERWGQGLASEEYQNAYNRFGTNQANQFNRLASIAGIGQTANNALGQAGSNYANALTGISQANADNQGNALLAAGNARASGYTGASNAFANSLAQYGRMAYSPYSYSAPTDYGYSSGGAASAAGAGDYPVFDYYA